MLDVPRVLGTASVELEEDEIDRTDDRDLAARMDQSPRDDLPLPDELADDEVDRALPGRRKTHYAQEGIIEIAFADFSLDPGGLETGPRLRLETDRIDGEEVLIER
ncbi:MAG TPA: hypothetical protein VKK31_27650 [Thermoanaerobaculia bacterium]|nr:hypothetical protein [Thermoanaerobaculia bacterium]